MLSPVDFIFNDYSEPPYYLEVQHFVNPDAIYTNSYLEPVSKIFNPYSTNDQPRAIDLTPTQIAEIYYDYLNSHSSKKNSFVENSPYFPGVRFISSFHSFLSSFKFFLSNSAAKYNCNSYGVRSLFKSFLPLISIC